MTTHSKEEQITAWVTKYALTGGIQRVSGVVCNDINSKMLRYGLSNFVHGNDWHRTEEAAVARANEMRQKKIASFRTQIAKLEKLTFCIQEAEAER